MRLLTQDLYRQVKTKLLLPWSAIRRRGGGVLALEALGDYNLIDDLAEWWHCAHVPLIAKACVLLIMAYQVQGSLELGCRKIYRELEASASGPIGVRGRYVRSTYLH